VPDGLNLHASLPQPSQGSITSSGLSPDAALIAHCQRYLALCQQWDDLAGPDYPLGCSLKDQVELNRLSGAMQDIVPIVVSLGCKTYEGLRALASVLATSPECADDEPDGGVDDRIPTPIVRSLLQGVDFSHAGQGAAR
jgi:hypothetical protein